MTTAVATSQSRAGLLTSTGLLAKRTTLTFWRRTELIVLSVLQMTSIMLTFRYIFGGAIGTSQGLDYVDFSVPGFITAGVLFQTLGTAIGMAEDVEGGFIDRLRSMPFPSSAVLTGRVLADTGILAFVLAITTGVGFAVGFRLHASVLSGLAAFALCLLFGVAFSWVFIAVGLFTGNVKSAQGVSMVVFIVTFASSAYVPVGTMPGWLQAFAENQPVTVMADAVRALTLGSHAHALLGHDAGYFVSRSLIWTAGITVVFAALGSARFRRR
ncbi:ABC transporter permease [Streptomyces sp. SID13666]|uniref:ABC transporter permease n=1 Tax=Streptomyces TaxID=1883 RepID=UPI001106D4EF|nr:MULTISPECIES: ABC transporter permease [Streptomyces]MCZ4097843.1 ABC transporter permease [Streptomyces sp. H39-C1]NEA57509.1 ABC transporter permease [Streptomyces sp. SID13666]NEA70987.1 ABC transporter permease [Streptomyces sp. SID13588]QNA76750.1 ABC transporter permease [Streptomyces sp. So13.3]